jgi:1,4-dihydroxy-2-naphthoate octaprenyltransferase
MPETKKSIIKNNDVVKNILLHLRLPFSYFLLPVFVFGLSESVTIDLTNSIVMFIALHFFIYPASNAYNSYMDKDKGSIGALRNPPPVSKQLYHTTMILDAVGILLMLLINVKMIFLLIVYILVSKMYSWRKIRLKKFPIAGWLIVVIFQGGYTFFIVSIAAENNFTADWFNLQKVSAITLSTLLIGAYYPLTQIYQHVEDKDRGDITISYLLGVTGTFIFSAAMFLISFIGAFFYFKMYFNLTHFYIFAICLVPAIA